MRLPTRKSEKDNHTPLDVHITPEKFAELTAELERLKKKIRPRLSQEVKRLAEMGDFSENAAYQIAKSKLRGINRRIAQTEYLRNHAVIIQPRAHAGTVELGSVVTVEMNGRRQTYQILGSAETDPSRGIISHNSPLGNVLLGRRAGEAVVLRLNGKDVPLNIISVA